MGSQPVVSQAQAIPSSTQPRSATDESPCIQVTSPSYSPPRDKGILRNASPPLTSNTTSLSSVDEEAPRPRFTSLDNLSSEEPLATVSQVQDKTAERKPSITSLNASGSRFMLRIPLLGRSKIPLEQAVAVAQTEDVRDPPEPGDMGRLLIDNVSLTLTQSATLLAASAQADTSTESGPTRSANETSLAVSPSAQLAELPSPEISSPHDNSGPEIIAQASARSSWWGYLGWRENSHPCEESDHSVAASPADSTPAAAHSEHLSTISESTIPGNPLPAAPAQDVPPSAIEQTPSTFSTETNQSHRSTCIPEAQNPIEASILTQRSGWASFFTSKSLVVKTIKADDTDKQEHGMEVMDVDDVDDSSTAVEIPVGQEVTAQILTTPWSPTTPKSPGTPPKQREPKKSNPAAPPLTDSESIKRETAKAVRPPSPTPSKASSTSPVVPRPPNLVLPSWEDTFRSAPRSYSPPHPQLHESKSKLSGALYHNREGKFVHFGKELPKALDVIGEQLNPYILSGGCRVAVIGVAGWSPGAVTRTLAGGLPSSSSKFVDMTAQALEQFAEEHGFKFKKITKIPLEGDGTIYKKVSRVYKHLLSNDEWLENLHAADVIFVPSHSQGAIVSTHLVDRLIRDGHILTARSVDILAQTAATITPGGVAATPSTQAQKVCFLSLCGIHLGPLRYLKTSSLLQPYIQNAAAGELFDFQDTETQLSKGYTKALQNVLDHGSKMVYVAPLTIRSFQFIQDYLLPCHTLVSYELYTLMAMHTIHLISSTAGTLNGIGHSTAYEESATYSLAVKYFFLTNDGDSEHKDLVVEPFNAVIEQNDYEIPWCLRDMIADERTTILREVKRKLQPITRLSSINGSGSFSKL
ncbi:hypothetical protein A0H81_05079 [Grifola frondosa]|uniref:YMC020W-like alpha/beta hydrolase domain-containing protein n=1 Tax=Grifola frondosa TaxID=5627 RepID=A0A1C7MCT4_GRIFR|nr:hypothetical protein A0H81_05079 [Grifola frondosa]